MARGVYKGLTIEFDGNTKPLENSLNQLDRSASKLKRRLDDAEKAARFDGSGPANLANKMTLLQRSIENANTKLSQLKEAEKSIGRSGMGSDQWDQLQADIEQTESKVRSLDKALQDVAHEQEALSTPLGKAGQALIDNSDKLQRVGDGMRDVGGALTRTVTTGIVAAGAASIAAATDMDTSLTNVRKTVDGTEEDYRKLKEAAIEYSRTNPVSAAQMLDMEALGAQLGYTLDMTANGKTELQEFGEVVSGLDIATNMDAETAGTNLAQFANITKMAKEDTSRYASALVDLGNNMATTESDISNMSMRVAAAGEQVGMSEADILGWSAAMSSLGVEAEAGGTAFSNTISTIDAAVATGGDELQTFADIAGMSAEDFQAAWTENATGTLQAMLSGLDGAENMTVALEEMGVTGIRQSDVLKRLAGNTDLVSQALGVANDGWEQNNALSNEVGNRNDSIASKFAILKNRVTEVADDVGGPLADALLEALDALDPLVDASKDGAESFADMGERQQRMVIGAVAATAALGPLLMACGNLVSSLPKVGAAMKALGGAMRDFKTASAGAKAGLVGLSVAAAAIVVSFAVDKWRDYQDELEDTRRIADGLANIEGTVAANTGDMADETEDAVPSLGKLRDAADDARESLVDMVDGWADSWSDIYSQKTELDRYVDTINRLADTDLSGNIEQQNELKNAVDGYNTITGDTLEVVDLVNGKLSESRDEIQQTADKWYELARSQQYQSQVSDLIAQETDLTQKVADAQATVDKMWADLQSVKHGGTAEDIEIAQGFYDDAVATLGELQTQLDGVVASEDEYTKRAAVANQETLTAITRNSKLSAHLQETGGSAADTANMFDKMGISVEDMGAMSEDVLEALTDNLLGLNATNLDPKTFTVNDDGTLTDTEGRVWDFNTMTIDDKKFTVTDDGSIQFIDDKVEEYQANLAETPATVTTDVRNNADSASATVSGYKSNIASVPTDHHTNFTATDSGVGAVIDNIMARINGIKSALAPSSFAQFNASGGMFPRTIVPIRAHADGGIAATPTLTNVGIIGEDGAEAVLGSTLIPLSNRRYVRPFARAVASEMPPSSRYRVDNSDVVAQLVALRGEMATMRIYLDKRTLVGSIASDVAAAARRG